MNDPMQRAPARNRGPKNTAVAAGTPDDTSPTLLDQLTDDGRRRQDAGQDAALHGSDVRWRAAAERVLADLAATGAPFDAEDVRRQVGTLASSPNAIGSLFSRAARAGLIVTVGYRVASRAERAGGLLRVWRGTGGG